jgi:purine-binding chemotaxis protein CheW
MTDEGPNEEADIELDYYLVFTTNNQEFGFPAIRILEISSVLDTTPIPNSPHYIQGIVNLRGKLTSVIDFRTKFGFEPKPKDDDTRIVMVEYEGYTIGVMVDRVEEVIKIPENMVQKIPESTSASISEEYITGIGMLEKRLIVLLDADKVLTKQEKAETQRLTRSAQKALAKNKDLASGNAKDANLSKQVKIKVEE